jgi:F-type H+-transporting ATPase subunit b
MLIDWFTVGAQMLNFLILVWLMRRFLYKPILKAIDRREKLIAAELADAETKKTEAKKESDDYKRKNDQFEQERAQLLENATNDAKAEGERLINEAKQTADRLGVKRIAMMRMEAHNLAKSIRSRVEQEVFAIARKTLTDLAATSLEERMSAVFITRLRKMDAKAKEELGESLKTTAEPVIIRSTYDLTAEQRASIQNALNETFSANIKISFKTKPDLISGIELTSNGHKVGWNISDYLTSLETAVGEILQVPKLSEKSKSEPKPDNSQTMKIEPAALAKGKAR